MKLFLNKKASSPLLVTIFLVAFAVALGAVVMSWGSDAEQKDSASCDEVAISPQVAFGREMICLNKESGKLRIIITNNGKTALSSIVQRQIGDDFTLKQINVPNSALKPGQTIDAEIEIRPGRVQIELVPEIIILNEKTLCASKTLIRENIPVC